MLSAKRDAYQLRAIVLATAQTCTSLAALEGGAARAELRAHSGASAACAGQASGLQLTSKHLLVGELGQGLVEPLCERGQVARRHPWI